jgi:DnaJ like chaperone protein
LSFGKFIGGGLGWVLGGPIGALVGFAIGSYFDSAAADDDQEELPRRTTGKHNQTQPGDFAMSLLVLISAVMNADGRVMRSELDMVKALLMRTYTDEQVKQYLLILRELLKKQVDVAGVCKQIRANMSYSQRLELLHILFRISRADGDVSEGEIRMLEYIAAHMGITTPDYLSVRAMFVTSTEADYEILEIKPDATDDEVKRAYRRMAMKYHPDKLSGLGEQMKKEAEDKFRRVQQAYEQIKKKRGMA